MPGVVAGPLAETAVRLASRDAEELLTAAEQEVDATEQYAARPQLLRARGLLLHAKGDLDGALDALMASADVARSQHACIQLGRTLDAIAGVATRHGDRACAAEAEAELRELTRSIGPEVAGLAWAQRVKTSQGRPVAPSAVSPAPDGPLSLLTPREREVAKLLARGMTNRHIAEALVIAEGTAGVHVDHILNKLGFRSRAQVAAWAAEHGLLAALTE